MKVFGLGVSAAILRSALFVQRKSALAHCVGTHGATYRVCEATATCAALYVDDHHEKEQVTNGFVALEGVSC